MDKKFEKILVEGAKEFGIDMNLFHVEQFNKYINLLTEWNKKINLTAIEDEYDIVNKHFLDSISVFKSGKIKGNEKIIDIGAGAGFPSIPIKIIFPNTKLTIIDSLKKRTFFLNELVEKLNLVNIKIIHGRAENFGCDTSLRESFDVAVSRAVASLNILSEYCLPFVKKYGYFISMKGFDIEEELNLSKNALLTLNGNVENVIDVNIPSTNIIHKLIIIQKTNLTNKMYPRSSKAIKKKPL